MSVTGPGTSARKVRLRGHEVVSHTTPFGDGRYCCYVFLFDPSRHARDLKIFKEFGDSPQKAEELALTTALRFLEIPAAFHPVRRHAAAGRTVGVAGRQVEIFCDLVGDSCWQAFPFLRRDDGTRALIMQFHLKEAVTADTPGAALARCVERLHAHFKDEVRGDA